MFTSLTITGSQVPCPVTLPRREAFPSRQYDADIPEFRTRPEWLAGDLPDDRGHLSIELGELIGAGRTAVVYAVKVVGATPGKQGIPWSKDPYTVDLCAKVARPNHCRSLAREAWVYEQLIEGAYQGVMAPRCYGFFAIDLAPELLPFPLLSNVDDMVSSDDDPTRDDDLPDDDNNNIVCLGTPGARELSPWVDWRPNPDTPLLSVLLMSRGGQKYDNMTDGRDPETRYVLVCSEFKPS